MSPEIEHSDILQLLCPVPWIMTDNERAVYGAALDRTKARLDAIAPEMFPDTAVELLPDWETLYQVVPAPGATIAQRQQVLAAKCKATGDIKAPYFVTLAAAMGYAIAIAATSTPDAGQDFTAGVSGAGDTLGYTLDPVGPFIWDITVHLVAGQVNPAVDLEAVLQDLKPAHRTLNFIYVGP